MATSLEEELDALTDILTLNLKNSDNPDHLGVCRKCLKEITGSCKGCTAMGDMYHVTCFLCGGCGKMLMGRQFFCSGGIAFCEVCHGNTLETCVVCEQKITDRILKAVGKSYHTTCFCCINCRKCLDGIAFSLDSCNAIHCVDCYQLLYSPRCAVCTELIRPTNETGETVHIIAMQKNFHIECYRCEVCDATLSTAEGRFLAGHLLCRTCNDIRHKDVSRKVLQKRMSTDL